MAKSNCWLSHTFENPCEFSVWCVLVKLSATPHNYSYPRPLALMPKQDSKKIMGHKLRNHMIPTKTLLLNESIER